MIPYGTGAGASLAVKLCADHPQISAVIVQSPRGDFLAQAKQDARARLVPVNLLFHENFPLADPLHALATPKLLISYTTTDEPPPAIFRRAADPKMTVELPPTSADGEAISRFLGSYVPRPPATPIPNR